MFCGGVFSPFGLGADLRGVLGGAPAPRPLDGLGGPRVPSSPPPLPLVAPSVVASGYGRAVGGLRPRVFCRLTPAPLIQRPAAVARLLPHRRAGRRLRTRCLSGCVAAGEEALNGVAMRLPRGIRQAFARRGQAGRRSYRPPAPCWSVPIALRAGSSLQGAYSRRAYMPQGLYSVSGGVGAIDGAICAPLRPCPSLAACPCLPPANACRIPLFAADA